MALHDQYIATLEAYQSQLTRAGKIDEAFTVKAEIERAKASDDVASARFALDVQEIERPAPPVVADTEISAEPPPAAVEQKTITTADGSIIYPAGSQPPRENTLVLKRMTLGRTPNTSLSTPITVSAWEGSRRSGESSKIGSAFSTYTSKTSSDDRFLRLLLRTGQSGVVMNNLRIVVHYYSQELTPVVGSRASDPKLATTRMVDLDQLDQNSLCIDVSPATFGTSSSSYGSYSSSRYGERYYGYIVSVFAKDGALLYQGASRSQLGEYATRVAPP